MSRLTLTIEEEDCVYVGDSIVVTVRKARSGRAMLSFDAPPEVKILRSKFVDNGTTQEATLGEDSTTEE